MRQTWLWACVLTAIVGETTHASQPDRSNDEQKITVTGSLIKQNDDDGPAPIFSISADDLARLGHTNLYDALIALTAQTGSLLEGDQFPNGFTSAAQALNLRGFGPGRTLVLVNGQRLALNPTPYQSESNFFNFAIIPTVAIERVDVLTDGASAIYGSDAIAGVINVILREEYDAHQLKLTYGDTQRGGGESFKLTGGNSFHNNKGTLTFGYQWENREPIYAEDRRYLSNVEPDLIPFTIGLFDFNLDRFVLPSANACDPHTAEPVMTNLGDYCTRGTRREENLRNKRDTLSLFSHGEISTQYGKWFADILLWDSETEVRSFPLFWNGIVPNQNDEDTFVIREFSAEETGNQDKQFDEQALSIITGFEGVASLFDYKATFSFSDYDTNRNQPLFRNQQIQNFFPASEAIFDRYQPSDFNGVIGNSVSNANSKAMTLSYWMSGEAFEINGNNSRYAVIAEWNKTRYRIDIDDTSANFGWFGFGGSSGIGTRDRYAVGAEWLLPLVKGSAFGDLELTLATRWDDYQDDSGVDDAKTWKASLQWKPIDDLSISTVHSTSFRAPDMHYLFADNTLYFTDVIDLFECINVDGNSFSACENNTDYLTNIPVVWAGNQDLEEETGSTQTLGVFYNPSETFSLSLDYYQIELENQVGLQLESQYLLWESQCASGVNYSTGESVDPNSEICTDASNRVFRNNGVFGLINSPVNRAFRKQSGVDLGLNWLYATDAMGSFGVDLQHSQILKTEIQQLSSEPSTYDGDFENSPRSGEVKSRTNLSLSWAVNDWSTALSFYRKGSKVNFDGSSKLPSWTIANFILKNELDRHQDISLIIRNLTDKKPPIDTARINWPYYDRSQYDAIGLEWFLEYEIRY